MDWFSVCLDGLVLAGWSVLHTLFVSCLAGKRAGVRCVAVCFLLLCGIEAAASGVVLAIAGELLALYAVGRKGFGLGRSAAGTAAVLAVYVSQLSFGMVNAVESAFFPPLVGRPALYALVVLAAVLALALCAGCYALILKFLSLKEDQPFLWVVLVSVSFFFAAELYLMYTAYRQVSVPSQTTLGEQTALLSFQALGLGALLAVLYACRRAREGLEARSALDSLAQAANAQKTYVAEAQARYAATRSFRHDVKNHLSVLDGLLGAGNIEAAREYLQKLDVAASSLSLLCPTGRAAVDVLLAEKLELARAQDIETDLSLDSLAEGAADELDLCVMFANALDNAVRGCLESKRGRWLRIRGERQGDFYRLGFENSCAPGPMPPAGVGLSNVRAAAEKYHGAMLAEKDGAVFRLDVLLNISAHPEDSSTQKP